MYILLLTVPETYAPVLLKRRAAKLRQKTGRDNIKTEQEVFGASLKEILINTLVKPFSTRLIAFMHLGSSEAN
jgi:hypothetical protein